MIMMMLVEITIGHAVRAHAWINRDQMGMSQIYGYYIYDYDI